VVQSQRILIVDDDSHIRQVVAFALLMTAAVGFLTPALSRMALLACPVIFLALGHTLSALLHLDRQQPVSCCAAVYGQFQTADQARHFGGIGLSAWGILFGAATCLISGIAISMRASPAGRHMAGLGRALTVASMVWIPISALTLTRVLSAYIYEVLHHPCPFCLFLPQFRGIGFFLFGLIVLVSLETIPLYPLIQTASCCTSLRGPVDDWCRQKALTALSALAAFTLTAVLPALIWRWRYGVWMAL